MLPKPKTNFFEKKHKLFRCKSMEQSSNAAKKEGVSISKIKAIFSSNS